MSEPPEPERGPVTPPDSGRGPFTPPPEGTPYGPGPWPVFGEAASSAAGRAAAPEYGGRWRRLIAAFIDGLIVYAATWLVTAPVLGFRTMYEGSLARQAAANLVAGVVAFLYYVLQHGRWGRTLGKRAMSLRVVRAEGFGAIDYGQAAWRLLFAYLVSVVTCGVGGVVDVAWILWDPRRQALHDKVAHTVVVKAEPGMPDPYENQRGG